MSADVVPFESLAARAERLVDEHLSMLYGRAREYATQRGVPVGLVGGLFAADTVQGPLAFFGMPESIMGSLPEHLGRPVPPAPIPVPWVIVSIGPHLVFVSLGDRFAARGRP